MFSLVVVGGGGMRWPPLQFLGEGSQIKLYLNLHHDLANYFISYFIISYHSYIFLSNPIFLSVIHNNL